MADDSKKDAAHAQFKKVQRAEDGKKAMSEYESDALAVRAKTARLRALRLARDTADPKAPDTGTAATKTTRAKKGKRTSATLSDWLKDQQRGGRNS